MEVLGFINDMLLKTKRSKGRLSGKANYFDAIEIYFYKCNDFIILDGLMKLVHESNNICCHYETLFERDGLSNQLLAVFMEL